MGGLSRNHGSIRMEMIVAVHDLAERAWPGEHVLKTVGTGSVARPASPRSTR